MWTTRARPPAPTGTPLTTGDDFIKGMIEAELTKREAMLREEMEREYDARLERELRDSWPSTLARARQEADEQVAAARRDAEDFAVAAAEQARADARAAVRIQMADEVGELQAKLKDWQTRAETAEAVTVALIEALLPQVDRPYHIGRHATLSTFPPLSAVSAVLAHGNTGTVEAVQGQTAYPVVVDGAPVAALLRREPDRTRPDADYVVNV